MATWDRYDICAAHLALEHDWNAGGWLQERPSNLRRKEATHVQLERIGFSMPRYLDWSFEGLDNDNQREIYIEGLIRFGLAKWITDERDPYDEIVVFIREKYTPEFIRDHFPSL